MKDAVVVERTAHNFAVSVPDAVIKTPERGAA